MKIAHVVTYVSPDGAFGGPVRVALGQAAELASRGHDVTVFAASPDKAPKVVEQDGYRLLLFPARRVHRRLGFAGMRADGLTRALRASLPALDLVHVHLARDLVTLPAARVVRKAGVRLVVQPHGMIDRSQNPLAIPIDRWETKPSLSAAAAVLTLTAQEKADIRSIVPEAEVRSIGNGIKVGVVPPYEGREGGIVFLARLHPRKRPLVFVEAAVDVLERHPDERFILAGPDEGEGEKVAQMIEQAGLGDRITWVGPIEPGQTDALLRNAKAFVLPSFGEVFPMTVLESFSAGTPVITTSSLGIADRCKHYSAAIVTDGSVTAIAEAIELVLSSTEQVVALREGARRFIESDLSIESVVDRLLEIYESRDEQREKINA
ncbi:glycosyltransferase [Microbacterium oleivorans]|uniref:Glycosyltransferase n=1 Tax=Microbacterium oleivorans TaxID=273677 RepID=A0A4R5YLB4_9MICO|nr:glycosyltransferase [Microbacterium oleivorans]TDL46285.1 glycosyltransferase [Microbacterium oleivorans]